MSFRLEDQFEEYPDQDDPEIQRKLARYYEMAECTSGRDDRKLPGDDAFTQQRLYQRLGYVYPRLALLAEAGVGKSQSEIYLSEYLKTHDPYTNRSYFLTGNTQIPDFKKQLVYGYAKSPYRTEKIETYKSASKGLFKTISNAIKTRYEVRSYGQFAGELKNLIKGMNWEEGNEAIRRKYSGGYFFLDEIQLMKITFGQTAQDKDRHEKYWLIWRLCHVVQRARITVASARPLTNTIHEFAYAMNLILPAEMQIPVDKVFMEKYTSEMGIKISYGPAIDWKVGKMRKETSIEEASDYYLEKFMPYLNGKIMFVASPETGVELSYAPVPQPLASEEDQAEIEKMRARQLGRNKAGEEKLLSRLRLLPFALTEEGQLDIQGATYLEYLKSGKKEKNVFEDRTQKEILTFTFPKVKGSSTQNWGIKAENEWLQTLTDGTVIYREGVETEDGKTLQWYLENSLASCSVKMAYDRHQAIHYPGKGYSFFDILHGGGTNIYGLVLEEGGPVFLKDAYTDKSFQRYNSRSYDINYRNVPVGELSTRISKVPRYAIITGESQNQTEMFNILDLFNHPDNDDGEFLKRIIISRVGQVGTNLAAVKYINSFFISHNPSDLYQAIRRAVRATSHIRQVEELRKTDPEAKFEIEVNLMVCIFPKGFKYGGSQTTADIQMMQRTYEKDLNNSVITRTYKRLAVTAWILDERNTLDSGYDLEAECDYMNCGIDYVTEEPSAEDYDYTNYLLLYAGYEIDQEAEKILSVLREQGFLSLIRYVNDNYGTQEPQRSICLLAAASMIDSSITGTKHDIRDRYGFTSNVVEKQGTLYLNRKNSIVPQGFFTSYYTHNLIAVKKRSIEEILEERYAKELEETLMSVEKYGNDMSELSIFINSLGTKVKALFLEELIDRLLAKKTLPENYTEILEIFTFHGMDVGNLIMMKEPSAETFSRIANLKDTNYHVPVEPDPDGVQVYVHNVYVFEQTKAKAGITTRAIQSVGRLRIRRATESTWRDTNNTHETIAYRSIFREKIAAVQNVMFNKRIYGQVIESNPGKFFIVDKTGENEMTLGTGEHHGCVCDEIGSKIEIVVYMWHVGMRPNMGYISSSVSTTIQTKRKELHNYEKTKGSGRYLNRYAVFPDQVYSFLEVDNPNVQLADDEMTHFFHFYLTFNQNKMPKAALCSSLAMFMYEKGLVISPTLNRFQILEILQRQRENSFRTAKEAKMNVKRSYKR